MERLITPIREFSEKIVLDGDYYLTQSAIFLGVIAQGETRLKNFARGKDTVQIIDCLRNLGCNIQLTESEIIISGSGEWKYDTDSTITFNGDIYPLFLLIGLVAGQQIGCRLIYADRINPIFIDKLIMMAGQSGIELKHNSRDRSITIAHERAIPIEGKISSAFPYFKNFLLMYGLASGRPIAIREEKPTDEYFEHIILKFKGKITLRDFKAELIEDPDDPRKKVRRTTTGYRKEMMLHPTTTLQGANLTIAQDSYQIAAVATLSILMRKPLHLENVPLHPGLLHFINHLKSAGVDARFENRRGDDIYRLADLQIIGRPTTSRKIAGEISFNLMMEIPFLILLAAAFPSTSVIRGISEFKDLYMDSLAEMARNLEIMGVKSGILEDGLVIEGKDEVNGGRFGPFLNPQIALPFYLVSIAGQGQSEFIGFEIIQDRFPALAALSESAHTPSKICESGS